MRTLARTLERTGVLQVDSVNVLQRAHYMPLYSRMGPYDVDLVRRASETGPRRMVEYWAHVQAYMPVDLWPVMRHRMARYRDGKHKWWGSAVTDELTDGLLVEISDRGASTARDLDDGLPRKKDHWGWNWSTTTTRPRLHVHGGRRRHRRAQQPVRDPLRPPRAGHPRRAPRGAHADRARRRQGARPPGGPLTRRRHPPRPGRLLPPALRARPEPTGAAPVVGRARRGGRAAPGDGRGLVGARPTSTATRGFRAGSAPRALLSPFDPVVWERERTESLFDFHYRIEIYTPVEKRHPRLLRPAVPARRPDRGARRPQGRPQDGAAAGEGGVRRARCSRRDRRGARRGAASGWPAGSVSPRSSSSPGATWPPRWRRRWPRAEPGRAERHGESARFRPLGRVGRVHPTSTTGSPPVPAILDKLLRIGEGKILRQLEAVSRAVNAIEDDFVAMSDDELRAQTVEFKERLEERRVARRPDARGVRDRARGRQARARPAPLRRPDHGRRGAPPRQHRRDEDR